MNMNTSEHWRDAIYAFRTAKSHCWATVLTTRSKSWTGQSGLFTRRVPIPVAYSHSHRHCWRERSSSVWIAFWAFCKASITYWTWFEFAKRLMGYAGPGSYFSKSTLPPTLEIDRFNSICDDVLPLQRSI